MPETPSVLFEYDNAANVIEKTDALGTVEYEYDQLSRIVSETREFTDITSETFSLDYTYHLGGQLKSVTDPFSAVVSYNRDVAGRLTKVDGTNYNLTGSSWKT